MIFDIETDGLLDELSVVHTLHTLDTETGERLRFNGGRFADGSPAPRDGSLDDGFGLLLEQDRLIGHNIIPFDIPAIQKVAPKFIVPKRIQLRDTMVMARLRWPNIKEIDSKRMKNGKLPADFAAQKLFGTHKLKAWGVRLGVLKADYDGEWHSFTQEMEEYAAQDPVTTKALWDKCLEREVAEEAEELEQRVQDIIAMQTRFGFEFDVEAAEKLAIELQGRKAELLDGLREAFPPWVEPVRYKGQPVVVEAKRRTKVKQYDEDGTERIVEFLKGETYAKQKLVSFNPASRQQIADRLKTLFNWVPVEFTDSGAPKVDETTLLQLDHIPQAKVLIDYLTVDKRLGQLAEGDNAWLKLVGPDGRMHGFVNTLGAITRRMTHSGPNVAQVPSLVNAKGPVPYGKECRSLFTVRPGNVLGGCDAEGLELRVLAHYMAHYDDGAYATTVVDGKKEDGTDVHTVNQKLIRLNSRNSAKTWVYAYLYGAGLLKLGLVIYEDMSGPQREAFHRKIEEAFKRSRKNDYQDFKERQLAVLGKRARERVEQGLPALGKLQEKVKRLAVRDGVLPTLDGGMLKVRSSHAALNTLLQGGGAIVMKKALVILADRLEDLGFLPDRLTGEWRRKEEVIGFTANIHDEYQLELPAHLADQIGQLAQDSIRDAGRAFAMRCPLAGSFDKGPNWAASH